MAFLKKVIRNMGQISKQVLPNSPVTNDEVSLSNISYSSGNDVNEREAIYPNWFFSSRLGQPRGVDTNKLRTLSKSPWAQMVLTTFKKQIETIPWKIVPKDDEDETDRTADIKKVTDFLNNINDNDQTVNDVNSELITDIAEIDAGCANLIFTGTSYIIGKAPIYNAWGQVIGEEDDLILKPLGQRQLRAIKSVDGSTMLKQVDIHKNLLHFWQYSFKHPRQNPTKFYKDEISYLMMNPKSYDVYGFSPMQSIQQVIELLIQGTRYNKDLYTNNAIPDVIISLPKLAKDQLRKLKRAWNNNYKGKPHQVGFINWVIDKVEKLNHTNRDLEWLEGQKWYFRLVFAVYGVSPEEAGFFENANKSNDEGQEKVTVRNALKPYMQKLENLHTKRTITEVLQMEEHGLMFKFFPRDHQMEKIEFDQDMQEIDHKTLTINEFRKKKGRDPVEWGDEPPEAPDPFGLSAAGNPNDKDKKENPKDKEDKDKDKEKNKHFKKAFEVFLNDSK